MSRAREALTKVVKVVATECEVPIESIMGRHSDAESVDARWICVKLLREHGFYPSRIAELLHITPRYVQYILTDFEDRTDMSMVMRTNYEISRTQLRTEDERIVYRGQRK